MGQFDYFTLLFTISLSLLLLRTLNSYFSGPTYSGPMHDLTNKYAVVTGGNTGIGKETVKALVSQGCHVIIGARDRQKSQAVIQELQKRQEGAKVEEHYLELGSFESIREFSQKIKFPRIDYLVNNAGVMTGQSKKLTKSGFQMHYGVNYLGHFYLTHQLWNKINQSSFFRVLNVSSITHRRVLGFFQPTTLDLKDLNFQKTHYTSNMAYGRSKLCSILFTHALADRIPAHKGISLSLHPGVVRTDILRTYKTSILDWLLTIFYPAFCLFTKNQAEGSQTTLHCMFEDPSLLKNGGYYADCKISRESKLVTKDNWDQLWKVSLRDCSIDSWLPEGLLS